jgi:hypothetical protein
MMEAASTSETSANFYQTTERNNTEDSFINNVLVGKTMPTTYSRNTKTAFQFEVDTDVGRRDLVYDEHVNEVSSTTGTKVTAQSSYGYWNLAVTREAIH